MDKVTLKIKMLYDSLGKKKKKIADWISENPGKKVCSLGPLIHNSSVLNSLAEKGLSILDENNIENADENSVVIIRAHGVSPDVQQKLKDRDCQIIDATCPRVVASQKNVRKFSREGYDVFLAGDKNHGEVLGIQGFAEGPYYLLQNKIFLFIFILSV